MKLKKMLPYLIVNILSFYLLPLLMRDTGSAMLILLFILPIIVAITSSIYGYESNKIDLIYSLLIAILFIPTIFVYMNITAWVYTIGYFIVSILFNFIGKSINRK